MPEKLRNIRKKHTLAAVILAVPVITIVLLLIPGKVSGDIKALMIVLLCFFGILLSRCVLIAVNPAWHTDGRFIPQNKAPELYSQLYDHDTDGDNSGISAEYKENSVSLAEDIHDPLYTERTSIHDKPLTFRSEVFDCDIKVEAEDVSDEYTARCITLFRNMSDEEKSIIIKDALADRERIAELSGDPDGLPENITGNEILRYIHPKTMYIISKDGKDPDQVEFLVEADADWYDGFEIAAINGRIVGAGEYSGDLELWRSRKE